MAGVALAVLVAYVRPAGRIWRGDTAQMPASAIGWVVAVTPRTYLSAVLCVGAVTVGFALGGVAVALGGITHSTWPGYLLLAGLVTLLANVVFVPLSRIVEATGRPKFLVPPPYRGRPGSLAAERDRRRRKRAGLAPTDHLVEIFEVRPEPDDDSETFLVAICADDECGWMQFADDDVLGQPEEERLRTKAAGHTTNVAREVQRRP